MNPPQYVQPNTEFTLQPCITIPTFYTQLQDQTLQELVYPLVQITMGTASLMPSAAFFPFRLHCASLLIALSRQTKVYIPVATLLLEVCRCLGFLL